MSDRFGWVAGPAPLTCPQLVAVLSAGAYRRLQIRRRGADGESVTSPARHPRWWQALRIPWRLALVAGLPLLMVGVVSAQQVSERAEIRDDARRDEARLEVAGALVDHAGQLMAVEAATRGRLAEAPLLPGSAVAPYFERAETSAAAVRRAAEGVEADASTGVGIDAARAAARSLDELTDDVVDRRVDSGVAVEFIRDRLEAGATALNLLLAPIESSSGVATVTLFEIADLHVTEAGLTNLLMVGVKLDAAKTAELQAARAGQVSLLGVLGDLIPPGSADAYQTLIAHETETAPDFRAVVDDIAASPGAPNGLIISAVKSSGSSYAKAMKAVGVSLLDQMSGEVEARRAAADSGYRLAIAAGLLTLTLGIALTVAVGCSITRPLRRLTAAATEVSHGNLDVDLPPGGHDELGRLSTAFAELTGSLQTLVAQTEAVAAERLHDPVMAHRLPGALGELAAATVERISHTTARLHEAATTDELTGLINRDGLRRVLELACSEGDAAVLFIDLDRFKQVNDHHGHLAGDELLAETARRLRQAVREGDVVARIGGDEFVVVLPDDPPADEAEAIAGHVRSSIERPMMISTGAALSVGASIGHARSSEAHSIEGLLAAADHAMYRTKHRSRTAAWPAVEPDATTSRQTAVGSARR